MCKDYARNGLPFNPYKDEQQQTEQQPIDNQTAQNNESGKVLVMGGKSPKNLMYDGFVEAGEQFNLQ